MAVLTSQVSQSSLVLRGAQNLHRVQTQMRLALVLTVSGAEMVVTDVMGWQVLLEPLAGMAGMGRGETLAQWVPLDPRDLLAHPMEEWCTLAGGGPPAPSPQELNWSMRAEPLAVAGTTQEEALTFCACQMIQST